MFKQSVQMKTPPDLRQGASFPDGRTSWNRAKAFAHYALPPDQIKSGCSSGGETMWRFEQYPEPESAISGVQRKPGSTLSGSES